MLMSCQRLFSDKVVNFSDLKISGDVSDDGVECFFLGEEFNDIRLSFSSDGFLECRLRPIVSKNWDAFEASIPK